MAPRGNKNAAGNKGGKGGPQVYDSESHPRRAYRLALLGLIDAQIAEALDVGEDTITRWKRDHPEFVIALKKGKEQADSNVAQSLYKRATGYSHKAVKILGDVKTGETLIVPYIERYPPDTAAAIFWLKNRKSKLWRDKQVVELEDPEEVLADALGVKKEDLP